MGNDHQHKKDKKNKKKNKKIDEDEFNKEDNNDKKDNIGEEFILEEWEVYNDKNKNIDNSVKFDKDLLISEANKDPYEEYKEIKMLGEGSYGQVFLVNHKVIGATRAMKIIQKVDYNHCFDYFHLLIYLLNNILTLHKKHLKLFLYILLNKDVMKNIQSRNN